MLDAKIHSALINWGVYMGVYYKLCTNKAALELLNAIQFDENHVRIKVCFGSLGFDSCMGTAGFWYIFINVKSCTKMFAKN